jgi:hypothetical protein
MVAKLLVASLALTSALKIDKPLAPVLKLRGGVDKNMVATAYTTIGSANAVMTYLATEKNLEAYGFDKPSPVSVFMMKFAGIIMTSTVIMSWCALNGMDTQRALAWGSVPFLVGSADTLLNDKCAALGIDPKGQVFNAALQVFFTYSLFSGFQSGAVMKFLPGWMLFNGVNCALLPEVACKMWGVPSSDEVAFFVKSFGYFMASGAALMGSLVLGNDATTAIGHSLVPMLLNMVDNKFVSKNFEKFGVKDGPIYAWAAIMTGSLVSLLM